MYRYNISIYTRYIFLLTDDRVQSEDMHIHKFVKSQVII